MLKSRTHFEQVPLEIVRKIIARQTGKEAAEPIRMTIPEKVEDDLLRANRLGVKS